MTQKMFPSSESCRVLRHWWDDPILTEEADRTLEESWCARCGSVRITRFLTATAERIGSATYRYSAWYAKPTGFVGRPSMTELRKQLWRRIDGKS